MRLKSFASLIFEWVLFPVVLVTDVIIRFVDRFGDEQDDRIG